jgi:hypothetical protein
VLLLLKLLLVPALVASVTMASRRWGLRVGGVLTALPMVAGPTLVFYAIEQGDAFAASAARTAMLGIAATAAFCVAYARSAASFNWVASLAIGWTAVAAVASVVYRLPDLRGFGELAIAVTALLVARRLVPARSSMPLEGAAPRWDLPLRMIASAAAVVVFTGIASLLGPRLSGVVSAFPVVTMILVVFIHAQHEGTPSRRSGRPQGTPSRRSGRQGHEAVATFLRGLLRGLHSFAVFCLMFSAALSAGWILAAAAAAALGVQLALQAVILNRRG